MFSQDPKFTSCFCLSSMNRGNNYCEFFSCFFSSHLKFEPRKASVNNEILSGEWRANSFPFPASIPCRSVTFDAQGERFVAQFLSIFTQIKTSSTRVEKHSFSFLSRSNKGIIILIVVAVLVVLGIVIALAIIFTRDKKSEPETPTPRPIQPPPTGPPGADGPYQHAVVASDAGPCSDIGRDILKKGGTAMDSAIAALLCIGVYNMHSAGVGGGGFMVVYKKSTNFVEVIDFREEAPGKANRTMYVDGKMSSRLGKLHSFLRKKASKFQDIEGYCINCSGKWQKSSNYWKDITLFIPHNAVTLKYLFTWCNIRAVRLLTTHWFEISNF